MTISGDRLRQLIQDFLAFVGDDQFGLFASQCSGLLGGEHPQIEMGGNRNRSILAESCPQISLASRFQISFAMRGTGVVKGGNRGCG